MIITRLDVKNLGCISHYSHRFSDRVNILESFGTDELLFALQILLNHKTTPINAGWLRKNTKIKACVLAEDRCFYLVATPDNLVRGLNLCAYDESGNDVTEKYLYLSSHSEEHDSSEVFLNERDEATPRFLRYKNEDLFYMSHELARRTDGFSKIKTFRAYLKEFVENFNSEVIRGGKEYEIFLDEGERYSVRRQLDFESICHLSECDKTLFYFLCFMKTAEFWQGFEELRNMNGVAKPLIIKNFSERLDESIDVEELLWRKAPRKRQIILLKEKFNY